MVFSKLFIEKFITKNLREKYYSLKNFLIKNSRLISVFFFILRISGATIFFIFFEFAFFSLYAKIGYLFYEIWLLQILFISGYGAFIFLTINLRISKFIKILKILSSIIMLSMSILIFGLLMLFFKSFFILKSIIASLIVYYSLNLLLTIKSDGIQVSKVRIKAIMIISLLFSTFFVITLFAFFIPNKIEINPKSEPELIFWCGSNQLPNETDIIEICKEYKIGFMPTIRRNMVGSEKYMQLYKNIIAHEINLYFVIGGDSEFYAHIDNAKEFPLIYEEIREWFLNESILNSPYVTSFSVDAEPPKDYEENMNKEEMIDSINYGINHYPSDNEIDEATTAMKEFTNAIKKDEKKCGMIRAAQFLDSSDNDNDLSLFMRNIYTLDIEWDFTVTMLYRTNRLQGDESDDPPPEYIATSLTTFFGAIIEGTKYTNSELSFYQNVAIEQCDGDTIANEQYIFIGNFKKEFEDTRYIKEKWYKKDLDICRHFNEKKVFFYDFKGFLSHYGLEGIIELGYHNQQHDKWYMTYNNSKSIVFFLFYCGLIFIDVFSFLERDLT